MAATTSGKVGACVSAAMASKLARTSEAGNMDVGAEKPLSKRLSC